MNSVTTDTDVKFYDMPEISCRTDVMRLYEPIYAYQAHFMSPPGGTFGRAIPCPVIHPPHVTSFPYAHLTSRIQRVQNHDSAEDMPSISRGIRGSEIIVWVLFT